MYEVNNLSMINCCSLFGDGCMLNFIPQVSKLSCHYEGNALESLPRNLRIHNHDVYITNGYMDSDTVSFTIPSGYKIVITD